MDEKKPPNISGPEKPRRIVRLKVRSSESKTFDLQACSAGAPATQTPPKDGSNEIPEQCGTRGSVIPRKEDNMAGQTTVISRHVCNDTDNNASPTMNDIHENCSHAGEEEIDAELDRLYDEESALAAKRKSPFWNQVTDEAREKEIKQCVANLRARKRLVSEDAIHRARVASQDIMPLSINDFSQTARGGNKSSSKAKKAQHRKRNATEGSSVGSGLNPGLAPHHKKPRVSKTATKSAKMTADILGKMNFEQLNGTQSRQVDKNSMEVLPPVKAAPAHTVEHLKKIEEAALQKPGVDEDAVRNHVRALGLMAQILTRLVSPSESKDDKKTVGSYKWSISGMAYPIHHHQLVAAGKMVVIEMDKAGLQSGLLFDHMGYGKTIETLALVVANPPLDKTSKNTGSWPTLVVCPKSARLQWAQQAKEHCPRLKVVLWEPELESETEEVFGADVLVASYTQVLSAYKKSKTPAGGKAKRKPIKSALFKAKFHRLVLDEIHEIRSLASQTFTACMKLSARHYWGLTGTPTPNNITELLAYLQFIRHDKITSRTKFREAFIGGKEGKLSMEERNLSLNRHLGPHMIRRTPNHCFLGTTLVELPNSHANIREVVLGEEENVIYRSICDIIIVYITKKADRRATEKEPKHAAKQTKIQVDGQKDDREDSQPDDQEDEPKKLGWTLLNETALRLRQCVASPLLLETVVKDGLWTRQEIMDMKEKARGLGCDETPFIDMFERWINELENVRYRQDTNQQEIAKAQELLSQNTCPLCSKTIHQQDEPHQAACGHVWCKQCLGDHIEFRKFKAPDQDPACTRCKKILGTDTKPYILPEPIAENEDISRSANRNYKKPRQRGDDYNGVQPKSNARTKSPQRVNPTLFHHLDSNPTMLIPLSAKMKGIIDQISAWQKEDPLDKIIVFTLFLDSSRLLARALQKTLGIDFLYYTGEMDDTAREAAKVAFAKVPEVKVMFASLHCGSQALNLTCANRVIIADPWWNHSAEQQAIGRVYRIGQEKETYSMRLLAMDTIDTNIHKLQLSKLRNTKDALYEFQADMSFGCEELREILGWHVDGDAPKGDDGWVEEDERKDLDEEDFEG